MARTFYVGHVARGRLFMDVEYGMFRKLGDAIEPARKLKNGVVIENVPAKEGGRAYGTKEIVRSTFDGRELKSWEWQGR